MENQKSYEVRDSSIHGKGVFALVDITKDSLIGVYAGNITYDNDIYVLWITDEDDHEYGIDGNTDLKYLNHSSQANACFYADEIYSERDIAAGEEITFHYGDDFEEHLKSLDK